MQFSELSVCEMGALRCGSGNLRLVSYNSTSLWVASCELIIRPWVGGRISQHYIKSTLSVWIIASLKLEQSQSDKIIWYILDIHPKVTVRFTVIYSKWKWIMLIIDELQKQLFTVNGMTFLQILDSSQETTAMVSYFSTVTVLAILLKQNGCFRKNFQNRFIL